MTDLKTQFQTPAAVAAYMASLMPERNFRMIKGNVPHILEPTPGSGNLVEAIHNELAKMGIKKYVLEAPDNYFDFVLSKKYDCILLNPPFSEKHAFGIPEGLDLKGMRMGYYMLTECMKMSDHIIALMPWFTVIDSDVRMRAFEEFGIKSITALPRKTFDYSRIQTCVLELHKGWPGITAFKTFNY